MRSVKALAATLLSLPPADLWRLCDQVTGRPELARAGWRLSETRQSPRPCADRDAELSRLADRGLSYSDLAHLYHIKPATVARAVQRFRRRCDSDSLSLPKLGYSA